MSRKTVFSLLFSMVLAPSMAFAGDALDRALAAIPSEAVGFVCVPSIKDLDSRYQKAINDLQLQMFVQPPMNSITGAIQMGLPMLAGIDEEGPLTVVLMPFLILPEIQQKVAFLISAKDPKAMIEAMNGQSTEDGLWSVSVMGMPHFAAVADKTVILGATSDVVQSIKKSENGIGGKLAKSDRQLLSEVSVGLWLDGERILGQFLKPMAETMLFPMMMMNAGPPGSFAASSAEINKKNFEMLLSGVKSMGFGLSLADGGLGLRGAMTTVPGSDLAKKMKYQTTSGSLLKGLSDRPFIVAFGQTADPAASKEGMAQLDPLFTAANGIEGVDKEKLSKLKGVLEQWAVNMTGLRGTVELLTPGPGGLIGISILIDTNDSAQWLASLGESFELAKQIALGAIEKKENEELKSFVQAVGYNAAAEEVEGAKVGHLKIDLGKINDVDQDELEEVHAVIGKDGPLFRFAPVGKNQVALSFGGGQQKLAGLMQGAKKAEAPLEQNPGIRKVSEHLPKERAVVGYLAADQILEMVKAIAKAAGEDELPVKMEAVGTPLAASFTGADGWGRFDLFLPTELILAGKNATMAMMAAQHAMPADEPAGEPADQEEQPPSDTEPE